MKTFVYTIAVALMISRTYKGTASLYKDLMNHRFLAFSKQLYYTITYVNEGRRYAS